jgi:PAS domain S-box-containing protein
MTLSPRRRVVGSPAEPPAGSHAAQFASLFAASPAATCVVDAGTCRIAEANAAICSLLGRDRASLLGLHLPSLLDGPLAAERLATAGGQSFGLGLALPGRDGDGRRWRARGSPVTWNGRPAWVVVFEPAAETPGEATLAGVVAAAQEAIVTVDHDLVIRTANPAALAMFRVQPDEAIGRPFERFVPGPYRDEYGAVLLGLGIAGELRTPTTSELLLLRADGEAFIGAVGIARAPQAGVGIVIRDVTAQRQAESALRETERRLEVLTAVAPVGIVRADAEGVCIYVNAEACAVLGCTREFALGRPWTSFVHPDDTPRHRATWEQVRSNGQPFEAVFRVMRPHGEVRWINARARAEIDEDGDVRSYIGAFIDVTTEQQDSGATAR